MFRFIHVFGGQLSIYQYTADQTSLIHLSVENIDYCTAEQNNLLNHALLTLSVWLLQFYQSLEVPVILIDNSQMHWTQKWHLPQFLSNNFDPSSWCPASSAKLHTQNSRAFKSEQSLLSSCRTNFNFYNSLLIYQKVTDSRMYVLANYRSIDAQEMKMPK